MAAAGSLSRRKLLGGAAFALGVAGAAARRAIPVAAADETKLDKLAAQYRDHPNGQQRCEICLQFQPPDHCQLVAGTIAAKGWCQYFAARDNAR